jgi:hypothetical protein
MPSLRRRFSAIFANIVHPDPEGRCALHIAHEESDGDAVCRADCLAESAIAKVDMLALASLCLVLMYKVAICHHSTKCYAISGSLFPISGGRPALPVPSPAAISFLSLLLSPQPDPLWGQHDLRVTIRSQL